jgi:hypothetical protein
MIGVNELVREDIELQTEKWNQQLININRHYH